MRPLVKGVAVQYGNDCLEHHINTKHHQLNIKYHESIASGNF